ncbi:MAG: hypothetical protein K5979_12375 [Ruminococcus sp.]|nr:hypothetical protein [Ruminococcus sp.]
MNGTENIKLPKFLESVQLSPNYFASPDPYVSAPSCHVDLPALSRYAKEKGKKIAELTKEEVNKFKI